MPDVCTLIFTVAGDRVALVTDAVAAAGAGPGRYPFAGAEVEFKDGQVRRIDDGRLAGSALTMIEAVKNLRGLSETFDDAVSTARYPVGAASCVPVGK